MSDEPKRRGVWIVLQRIAITGIVILAAVAAFIAYGHYREWQSFGPFPIEPQCRGSSLMPSPQRLACEL
jgi:hypothetical protein